MGGTKATAEELGRMFAIMEQNGLLKPTRVLTGRPHLITSNRPQRIGPHKSTPGFIFGADALSIVARTVTKLLQNDPNIIYLLDRE
jgi:pyridoxine kinase